MEPLLDQGYRVHTLFCCVHGKSEGRGRIHHWRLSDYVSDAVSIPNELSEPAIVVGHLLGLAIAQVLIRDECSLATVVLLSPVLPRGLSTISLRMLWSDPIADQQLAIAFTVGVHHVSDRVVAGLLCSKTEVTDDLRRPMIHWSDESPRFALDLQGFPRIAPLEYDPHRMSPVMIVSGDDDQLIRPRNATESALLYQTDVQWISGGSHMLMYDAGAKSVSHWIGYHLKRVLN